MKTLNLTLRTLLLALTLVSTASIAFAYDFVVNGIYYDINGDEATVTYKTKTEHYGQYSSYYTYENDNTGDVIIPETVTYNEINYTVTTIGEHAFEGCTDMTSIVMPKTVTNIKNQAFWTCNSLKSVTIMAITPPSFGGTSVFGNYSSTLYVPLVSLSEYKTAYIWDWFSDIIGFGQNTFAMMEQVSLYGDTIIIPVSMENVDNITAFQTDIYIPNGFELLKNGDDYMVELSNRKGRDHVIMASDAPDGGVRLLSYSPTLKTFSGNNGDLFYFFVKAPIEGTGIGVYPIWLRKTILTTIEEEEIGALESYGNVSVYFYILGDVDHSGYITVADVVETARYILYQNPEPFVFEAADMNGDGKITITDVVKIANLILDQNYEPSLRGAVPIDVGNRLSGEAHGNTVSINLDNEQEYTAMQMDLTLPEGMTASDFALTDRACNLGLIVKDRGNGKVRVVCYTPDLKTISGNNGAVLTFNVDGTMSDIMVDHIEVVNLDGQPINLDAFTIAVSNSTALSEMSTGKAITSVEYFNLAGQQITKPATGVTLVVTTYTDGTRTTAKVVLK